MSQYLISQLKTLVNVEVRTHTEVIGVESESRLRALRSRSMAPSVAARRRSVRLHRR